MRAAVFLDRDDTITDSHPATSHLERPGDLFDPELVRLLPGAAAAIARLNRAGFVVVCFTSQGGVARGPMANSPPATIAQVERVNDRVRELLAKEGARLDALYYCPFHPKGVVPRFTREDTWRKPGPGMILTSAAELGLDISQSWAAGDMARDVEAAINAGVSKARAIRLHAGPPEAGGPWAPDLAGAVEMMLRA